MAFKGIAEAQAPVPARWNTDVMEFVPSGKINVGDPLIFKGNFVVASPISSSGQRLSAIGIAMQSNPTYDSHGAEIYRSGLLATVQGVVRVSAVYKSNAIQLGHVVTPRWTGSGAFDVTGKTGIPPRWSAVQWLRQSANHGVGPIGMGRVVRIVNPVKGNANDTGTIDVMMNWMYPGALGTY